MSVKFAFRIHRSYTKFNITKLLYNKYSKYYSLSSYKHKIHYPRQSIHPRISNISFINHSSNNTIKQHSHQKIKNVSNVFYSLSISSILKQTYAYVHNHKRNISSSVHPFSTDLPSNVTKKGILIEDEATDKPPNTDVTFELIFNEISEKMGGDEYMIFPKDIMWLSGAPGAGKGDMSSFIEYQRGYQAPPIRISDLVIGPEVEKLKTQGNLVDDRLVVALLLEKLLQPIYKTGVIVDGFPRTKLQAESIKLLFDKMLMLRRKFDGTPYFPNFRRPKFHVTVLYVGMQVSVDRQLQRGKQLREHNERVEQFGIGEMQSIRETDLDPIKARHRYQFFLDHIYSSLQVIKEKFPFHFINAEASKEVVQQRITAELEYQSTAELADETYETLRILPIATEIKKEARQQLVLRLDAYLQRGENERILFMKMIAFFKSDLLPYIEQQALTGTAVVNSESSIFNENPIALGMLLDIMAERGYKVIVDYVKRSEPIRVDLKTGDIESEEKRIYKFNISFPSPTIRHAMQTYEAEKRVQ